MAENKTYLSKNFYREEFACPCGCGFDDINQRLINRLQTIRDIIKVEIIISSGCRCPAYNASVDIQGLPDSAHLKGKAADIVVNNSTYRYKILPHIFQWFFRVGLYIDDGFIHVDIDIEKDQLVCW